MSGKQYNSGNGAIYPHSSGAAAPRHEKTVTYWENKTTGDYRRDTFTERSTNDGGVRTYKTVTVGNKSTGQTTTIQQQQAHGGGSYGSGSYGGSNYYLE